MYCKNAIESIEIFFSFMCALCCFPFCYYFIVLQFEWYKVVEIFLRLLRWKDQLSLYFLGLQKKMSVFALQSYFSLDDQHSLLTIYLNWRPSMLVQPRNWAISFIFVIWIVSTIPYLLIKDNRIEHPCNKNP